MNSEELIKRLRKLCPANGEWINLAQAGCKEAADLIEHQAARIAELEAQAGEAVAEIREVAGIEIVVLHKKYDLRAGTKLYTHPPTGDAAGKDDTARLDWLIDNRVWINWTERDGSITQCQAFTQDEDENYHILSGEHRFFNTSREAIDSAIAFLTKPATGEKP